MEEVLEARHRREAKKAGRLAALAAQPPVSSEVRSRSVSPTQSMLSPTHHSLWEPTVGAGGKANTGRSADELELEAMLCSTVIEHCVG